MGKRDKELKKDYWWTYISHVCAPVMRFEPYQSAHVAKLTIFGHFGDLSY